MTIGRFARDARDDRITRLDEGELVGKRLDLGIDSLGIAFRRSTRARSVGPEVILDLPADIARIVTIAYLGAGLLFIFSLGGLSAQESARRGNVFGMLGMLIAVAVTAFGPRVESYGVLSAALVIGGAIGALLASRVEMTSMPQLVAILHSFVGAAAVLVGIATAINHTRCSAASKRAFTKRKSSSASSSVP